MASGGEKENGSVESTSCYDSDDEMNGGDQVNGNDDGEWW